MSIYVTGDIHGDLSRFSSENFENEGIYPEYGDMFIVAGDFGIPFIGNGDADFIRRDEDNLRALTEMPYLFAFCDGTNDNTEYLNTLPDKEWNGGLVNQLTPNLVRLKTGHIFTIEDMDIFVYGGGVTSSFDKKLKSNGIGWWETEVPTEYQFTSAIERLCAKKEKVDYIITYTPPVPFDQCSNKVTAMLKPIKENTMYKMWYSGCIHTDRFYPKDMLQCVYQTFHKLG